MAQEADHDALLPATIGPYRIVDSLGAGGGGAVYHGVEIAGSGRHVAIKTVFSPHPHVLTCIRREIHALARLSHPDIVRIVNHGVEAGKPWYAMELIEGESLACEVRRLMKRDLLTGGLDRTVPYDGFAAEMAANACSLPAPPAPGESRDAMGDGLTATLTVFRNLCEPLAYLHGEGIVHRDLKPDNILVRADGVPIIIDFGLLSYFAAAANRETLDALAAPGGTLSYMAPEQLRGELVDARADLYAFGCMLYEAVAGRPPFLSGSAMAVSRMHLFDTPGPPSHHCRGLAPELDDLILRLLEKQPSRRHGYALDVARALEQVGALAPRHGPLPRAGSYLYRPGLAGRQAVMAELGRALDEAREGRGRIVLVAGESGVGKTRVLLEAGHLAARRRFLVATAECAAPPPESGESSASFLPPLYPFRSVMRAVVSRCLERGAAETARLIGPRAAVLAATWRELRELPGLAAVPAPCPLPAQETRMRLFSFLLETLAALAQALPTLVLIDDLQWADELTIDFLAFLGGTSAAASAGLLVVATFRTDDRLQDRLDELRGAAGEPLRLERLDLDGIGRVVADMLSLADPPPSLVGSLARHSEGNPFFVAEYLKTAVAEGLLARGEDGRWHVAAAAADGEEACAPYDRLPIPASLQAVVAGRLRNLAALDLAILRTAAVLGRAVDVGLLARASGVSLDECLDSLSILERRQVLEQTPAGQLRFAHQQIQEVVYEEISRPLRRELHGRAAEALQQASPAPVLERRSAMLAHHWQMAGERARAREHYLEAAREAARSYALKETGSLYQEYLGLVETPSATSIRARVDLCRDVLIFAGRNDVALDHFRRGLEESRALGETACAAACLQGLAVLAHLTGQIDEAVARYDQALAAYQHLADRRSEAQVLNQLAGLRWQQGDSEQARGLAEAALELQDAAGHRRDLGVTLGNLANLYQERGALAYAEELYKQALELHREVGNTLSEGVTLGNLAQLYARTGRTAEAHEAFERALRVHRELGNRRYEHHVLASLSDLERRSGGDCLLAETLARQAEAMARLLGERLEAARYRCATGHARLARSLEADADLEAAAADLATVHPSLRANLGQSIERLRAAIGAARNGQRLTAGDIPAAEAADTGLPPGA
ncbi:MAG: tetratricopeptide repeat protein [Candidatus Schekmanbacteria bacterium]|nr:tetratricopeptide repeat protein [Candidatus Schekmanbacteria bacterium]